MITKTFSFVVCLTHSLLVLSLILCNENTYLFGSYHQSISGYFNPAGDQEKSAVAYCSYQNHNFVPNFGFATFETMVLIGSIN